MVKVNGMSNKELLIELRNDVKHIAINVEEFKKIAISAKDRSIRNETTLKDMKWFTTAVAFLVTVILNLIMWIFKKKGG